MNSIEQLLAFHLSQTSLMGRVQNAQIIEDESQEPWLVFELVEGKTRKLYKKQLRELLWGPISQIYETYVATQLLRQGYVCIPIEGGWLVINPEGEEYQLQENSCTCQHFVSGRSEGPCKHLILRDWHNSYKARINEYRKTKNA